MFILFICNSDEISVDFQGIFRSDGSIGGIVRNESLQLSDDTEYIANASIIIAEGGEVSVGSNTSISFASDCGILVLSSGVITIGASDTVESSQTLLKPSISTWKGIILQATNDIIINNVFIEGADVGITHESNGLLSISNSVFEKTTSHSISINSASTTLISNVNFNIPGGDAIYHYYSYGKSLGLTLLVLESHN